MQKLNADCYYFLTSSCAKGLACAYRHNPLAIASNVICPAWQRGNCIDPSCSLRHSAVPRPAPSNGMTCFYENTPMGCLKPDCTYIHLRPRPNLRTPPVQRSSTTNLINKETIRPSTVTNSLSTDAMPNTPVQSAPIEPSPAPEVPAPITKPEIPPPAAHTTIPVTNKPKEVIVNNTISLPVEKTKTVPPPVTGSRNVVIGETANVSTRTVVQRVVVAPEVKNSPKKVNNDSDSDIDFDELVEQENDRKKMNGPIDISFPCAAPSITNRLFTSSKQSPPSNSTKPIRLNRDRLPTPNTSISNSATSLSSPSNGEKTSAGTGLLQDEDRRTSRLERFKKQPTSPPRTVVDTTRSIVQSKRQAPQQTSEDSPPAKRLSSHQGNQSSTTIGDLCSPPSNSRRAHERHHRRRRSSSSRSRSRSRSRSPSSPRKSPMRSTYSSPSSMNDTAWKKEVDAFLARTTQPKAPIPTQPRPVPLLSLRPPYVPPTVRHFTPRHPIPRPRPRQPPSTVNKRPTAPVISPPAKPVAPTVRTDVPAPRPPPQQREDPPLELDEPSDVVDTFALIDEALFGVDDLLGPM